MLHFFGMGKAAIFATGAVAGVVGTSVLKSKTARKVAVKGLAKGMLVANSVKVGLTNLKEEAEDICAEAKEEAVKEAVSDLDFGTFDTLEEED